MSNNRIIPNPNTPQKSKSKCFLPPELFARLLLTLSAPPASASSVAAPFLVSNYAHLSHSRAYLHQDDHPSLTKPAFPESIDHTPRPHPASPTGKLPEGFGKNGVGVKHASFSSYRQHAQQHGPLQKTIRSTDSIGAVPGSQLGSVAPPKGTFFDVSELPARFHRKRIPVAELEAVESGGASLFG